MSSLGGRNEGETTFLSHCVTYRKNVNAVDNQGAASTSIPFIRMDIDRQSTVGESGQPNKFHRNTHGHNGVLVLFVKVTTSATVQLWAYNTNDDVAGQGDNSGWFLVSTSASLTVNTMLTYQDLPALKYKVLVSAVSGPVTILERHTE
jgi:hypothetical protein